MSVRPRPLAATAAVADHLSLTLRAQEDVAGGPWAVSEVLACTRSDVVSAAVLLCRGADDALALVHQVSRGLPRAVNNLALQSLVTA